MKKTLLLASAVAVMVVATAALLQGAARESSGKWLSLAESVQPLRDQFNEHKGQLRFVALLSPT